MEIARATPARLAGDYLPLLMKDLRFKVDLLGVLLTMVERGTKLHQAIADEIKAKEAR